LDQKLRIECCKGEIHLANTHGHVKGLAAQKSMLYLELRQGPACQPYFRNQKVATQCNFLTPSLAHHDPLTWTLSPRMQVVCFQFAQDIEQLGSIAAWCRPIILVPTARHSERNLCHVPSCCLRPFKISWGCPTFAEESAPGASNCRSVC
jgi:hypothetical protein